jgi:N-6 DNA Methylase
MIAKIKQAIGIKGKLPWTLIVLDEVQQYIGDKTERSRAVQDVQEQSCSRLGANVMFVATGQSALSGTPLLQRLSGRIPIPIELQDTDVEQVTREVILKKKPSQSDNLERFLDSHIGEIQRHFSGTNIGLIPRDRRFLAQDYPILPVRRRFWERVLRSVDKAGTGAQLRTQLWIVYDAVQKTAELPLGNVVSGAFLYEHIKTRVLHSGVLLHEIAEKIEMQAHEEDGELKRELCALTFLIGQHPHEGPLDTGIRASAETLSDLLVTDLVQGSVELRKKVPQLLERLVASGAVMPVGDEYRIQTREGTEWTQAFDLARNKLLADSGKLAGQRSQLLVSHCNEILKKTKLLHGTSKEPRKFELHFGGTAPTTIGPTIPVWISRLRARGRQAGDVRNGDKSQSIDHLTQELAYEYWHRMLFARFLAENHLLMHPDGVAVSLEECEELAKDADPPAPNGFVLAARYASRMLPRIFRTDDVLLEIDFAPEQRLKLEKLLASLPRKTFLADDSLGWVYQFWQSKKKEEVNKSGAKIDGRTLSAVTQLFTEHYMVEFLLHNTIGAWWCGRNGIQGSPGGAGVPAGKSPVEMEYLRWREDGTPATGKFEGWPKTLAEFTMLDPCCGSGHFLVAAFNLLMLLRMHDEKLTAEKACEAVLRDNLFGLELDPRCTQIAAFALALAAWRYPDAGGYRPLPPLNIACSGQGVVGSKADWVKFANGEKNFAAAMGFLYDDFLRAPTLGSLINPRAIAESIFQTGFDPLRGSLDRVLRKAETQADPERSAVGVAAQGIAVAASLMARRFTLVATNVPYLARGKQDETIQKYLADVHPAAKADLATAFVERCLEYCAEGGSSALVTPQNWLFLGSYKGLREWMLRQVTWDMVAKLGPAAFDDMNWWAANTMLSIHTVAEPEDGQELVGLDASAEKGAANKAKLLLRSVFKTTAQSCQSLNPDARISLEESSGIGLLSEIARSHKQ